MADSIVIGAAVIKEFTEGIAIAVRNWCPSTTSGEISAAVSVSSSNAATWI